MVGDTERAIDELRREIAQQQAELQALRARIDAREDTTHGEVVEDRPVSRRRLLGLAGAAAAGVGVTALSASPAGAVHQPEDIGIDLANSGTTTTGLTTNLAGGSVFYGVNSNTTSAAIGIHGDTPGGFGRGVYGSSAGGSGVQGFSTAGAGVSGDSPTGNSLYAFAPNANGAGGHIGLQPASVSGPPTGNSHALGQFWLDSAGVLWQCVVAGNPAQWVRQSPLVLLASPFRVYDSRAGQPNPSGSPQGALALGVERTINCTPALPAGITVATGLLMNVTLANTVGAKGAVTVYSAAVAAPSTSSVNWAGAGVSVANAVTSACDASQDIKVKCVSGTSTQFIVDVIGYYP
jgi:hypothetical protein